MGANLARRHLRVGVDLVAGLLEAPALLLTRGHHAPAYLSRAFGCRTAAQLFILDGRHLNVNVDAIEQRAGDLGHVALDHRRRTHALARLVVEVAAGAWVHGRGQHEARREAERHGGARNGDGVILKRLPHHLQHVAWKLRQFVEEQQAVVCERDLARTRNDAAADQACVGDGVVRRAEGPLRNQARGCVQHAGDGVNLGGLQGFVKRERRKNRRQPLGQHRLAGAGRPNHENVMAACRGHLQRAFGGLLPAHIFEVHAEVLQLSQKLLR